MGEKREEGLRRDESMSWMRRDTEKTREEVLSQRDSPQRLFKQVKH